MDGLKVSDANLLVHVHPSKSNSVSEAVLRELGSMLFKFNEIFEGVLLAYDVEVLGKNAKILSGIHPYFGVRLKAKLLLFSPMPDMLLVGKVVKIKEESIHVIVLGFSSATITDNDIRKEFKYKTKHDEDIFSSRTHKRHVIKVGTMIRFLVKSFDEEILHISGSLVPDHTGSILWLEKNLKAVSLTNRVDKRKGEGEGESSVLKDNGTTANVEAFTTNHDHYTKKSKRQRSNKES